MFSRQYDQRAKKVVSDSPGLVDFAIGLVNPVFNLPDGQGIFLRNSNNRRTVRSILLLKKLLGLVETMSGLVNVSFSLPEWQPVKMIFFAPWWLWSMHAHNLGLRNLVIIIVVLVSCVACFLTNLILYWILLWSKFHTSLAWLVFYHMAGSVSNQDDQRQLLCSDSAIQILLRARNVTTRKKLFFQ